MPTTNPGDVWVIGQRRAPGGSFPSAGSGTGDHDDGSGIHSNQDTIPGPDDPMPYNPCAEPASAAQWNSDAAAAEAAKKFAEHAANQSPPEDLNTREWGAYLYRAGDGSIQVGPITHGDPFSTGGVGGVALSPSGIDPSTIVGSVHSHSVGNHLPSPAGPDGSGDINHLTGMINFSGNQGVNLYIVALNTGPAGFQQYNQINMYNGQTAQSAIDANQAGPEVNPEGTPCPST